MSERSPLATLDAELADVLVAERTVAALRAYSRLGRPYLMLPVPPCPRAERLVPAGWSWPDLLADAGISRRSGFCASTVAEGGPPWPPTVAVVYVCLRMDLEHGGVDCGWYRAWSEQRDRGLIEQVDPEASLARRVAYASTGRSHLDMPPA